MINAPTGRPPRSAPEPHHWPAGQRPSGQRTRLDQLAVALQVWRRTRSPQPARSVLQTCIVIGSHQWRETSYTDY